MESKSSEKRCEWVTIHGVTVMRVWSDGGATGLLVGGYWVPHDDLEAMDLAPVDAAGECAAGHWALMEIEDLGELFYAWGLPVRGACPMTHECNPEACARACPASRQYGRK